jgi:kinesin family protein 2/24
LEEEESVINSHRKHIDDIVDFVKQEMLLLNEVDKPGSDVEEYVKGLDNVLNSKMQMIAHMRQQLVQFHSHLKTEEMMSKLYQ